MKDESMEIERLNNEIAFLKSKNELVCDKLEVLARVDAVFDSTLEQMLNRSNIKDVIGDISDILKGTGDFHFSEINVFAREARELVGKDYFSFMKTDVARLIDGSLSSFPADQLPMLVKDIKLSAFMTMNVVSPFYVEDAFDAAIVKRAFAPIYSGMNVFDIDADVSNKIEKAKSLNTRSHVSALLYSYHEVNGKRERVPLGYLHLTKQSGFTDFERYVVKRIVNHSSVILDNYFNIKNKMALKDENAQMMKDEIDRTSHVVKSLIPVQLPEIDGLDLAAYYRPMDGVGGDSYDIFKFDDGNVGFLVFDVSGHGLNSCVIAASAKNAFVQYFKEGVSLPDVLKNVSNYMSAVHPGNQDLFLTAALAVLNPKTGELNYALAGHEAPLLYRTESNVNESLHEAKGGLIFFGDGCFSSSWKSLTVQMNKGDYLLIPTDGLLECFTEKRASNFRKGLYAMSLKGISSPQSLIDCVLEERKKYSAISSHDDVTCVVARLK